MKIEEILKKYRAGIWEEASGQCQFQDTLNAEQTVEAISILHRADIEAVIGQPISHEAIAERIKQSDGISLHDTVHAINDRLKIQHKIMEERLNG